MQWISLLTGDFFLVAFKRIKQSGAFSFPGEINTPRVISDSTRSDHASASVFELKVLDWLGEAVLANNCLPVSTDFCRSIARAPEGDERPEVMDKQAVARTGFLSVEFTDELRQAAEKIDE